MSVDLDLRGAGRVALITGGASGLGRAVGETFASAGYRVLLVDLDRERGEEAVAEIVAGGGDARFFPADVSLPDQVEGAVAAAVESWSRLDFVFNGAGVLGVSAPIDELDEADLDRVLAVNLKGTFLVCKYAVRAQKRQGGGSILNVASITGVTGSSHFAPYCASKAGVAALTVGLARSLGRFNIRINCLNPGSIAGTRLMERELSEMPAETVRRGKLALLQKIPVGRLGQPADVAHLALFLASPLAAHIHGSVLRIDGGEMLGHQ